MFILLKLKKPEGQQPEKFLVNANEISGVIDAADGVLLKLKDGSQAVVVESFQTVKNRIAELCDVV